MQGFSIKERGSTFVTPLKKDAGNRVEGNGWCNVFLIKVGTQ